MDIQPAISLIKRYEGCVLHAYYDSVHVLTIGYGHTRGVKPGMRITQEDAEAYLREDLSNVTLSVKNMVKKSLNDNQYCALFDFAFNLGAGALYHSHLLTYLNQGLYDKAAEQFARWNHAGGMILTGLTERRAAERELFLKPMSHA